MLKVLVLFLCLFVFAQSALAEDAATPAAQMPARWQSSINLSGQIDAGLVGNFDSPPHDLNFGQLSTDHANANQDQLNQILITAQRSTDPTTAAGNV